MIKGFKQFVFRGNVIDLALYLFFVAPMNKYRAMTGQSDVDTRPPDVQLLEEIRDLLQQQAGGTKSS